MSLKSFRACIKVLLFCSPFGVLQAQVNFINKPVPAITQAPAPATVSPTPVAYILNSGINYVRSWDATGPVTDAAVFSTQSYTGVKQTTTYLDGLGRPVQTVLKQAIPSSTSQSQQKSDAVGSNPIDLVSMVSYDAMGREQYKYMPYVDPTNNGNFKLDPFNQQKTFLQSQYPGEQIFYGQTAFEPSPLNRPLKTFAQGNSWGGSGKGIEQQYLINTTSNDVKIWAPGNDQVNFDNNIPTTTSAYAAGQLFQQRTIDENGNAVVEFKDKEGQVILKKVQSASTATLGDNNNGWLCTYYVYDDLNRLRFVIPPKAAAWLAINNWSFSGLTGQGIVNEICYRYEYDNRSRMIAKKVPGAGWNYLVYDRKDRQVFMQDANMGTKNQWLATLYDGLNRIVFTGMIGYANGRSALQAEVLANSVVNSAGVTGDGVPPLVISADMVLGTTQTNTQNITASNSITLNPGFGTDINSNIILEIIPPQPINKTTGIIAVNDNPILPSYNFIGLTITNYDNYAFNTSTGKNYTVPVTPLNSGTDLYPVATPSIAQQALVQTKGMVTGTRVRTLPDPNNLAAGVWLSAVIYYDDHGRMIQVNTENYRGGIDKVTNLYNFTGKVLSSRIEHSNPLNTDLATQQLTVQSNMQYDFAGRLLQVSKSINGTSDKIVATNTYDILGQLSSKELGQNINGILDYSYNVRGWLKGINKDYANNITSNRWFGTELNYDWGFGKNQLNGNISGTKWRSKGSDIVRSYGYGYDRLNRLVSGDFAQGANYTDDPLVNFDMNMGQFGADNNYIEGSAYDENGNIKAMTQWGLKLNSSNIIDNLSYNYLLNSNKLQNVVEAAGVNDPLTKLGDFRISKAYVTSLGSPLVKPVAAQDYNYDLNGNLTKDLNKDIDAGAGTIQGIQYNHLNLPWKINVNNKGTITYLYDALGNKLEKQTVDITVPGPNQTSGSKTTSYIAGFVYENNALQFFAHEEGRIRYVAASTGVPVSFPFDYFIKDHLGNVRSMLTDEQQVDKYPAATMELAAQALEESLYTNLAQTRVDKPVGYPVENTTNTKVAKLNGTSGANKIGPYITLKVMAGDKFSMAVNNWYKTNGVKSSSPQSPIADLVTALANGISGATSVHNVMTAPQLQSSGVLTPSANQFLNTQTPDPVRPKAYLNWILLDEQFNYLSGSGSMQVPAESAFGSIPNQTVATMAQLNLPVDKSGYLYIYVSNETPNIDVFFDNLQVTQTRGPLLEETHYYPFGLTMSGISSKAAGKLENRRKYNAGTELNTDFDLNFYETNFRSLDPQIGRFWQIDPMADAISDQSPYVYANNNPIIFNDPLGLLSDSSHPVDLSPIVLTSKVKVPNAFVPYINFPNGKSGDIGSMNDWPLSFSRNRSNDLVDSWGFGLGSSNRVYLPYHPMTKRLKNAYQVNRARAFFYKKYLTKFNSGASMKGASVTNFNGSFGLFGLLAAGTDIVEQFVGSMDINIQVDEKGENMLFIVGNNTSRSSALYHAASSFERTPGNEAMGNLYQVYIWQEPITTGGFSNAETENKMDDWNSAYRKY